jgi:predicted  nucleic acid-binding Zn-ribbon protein
MLPEIEQFLILQDRDQKLKQLKAELATIPLEQKRTEQLLASKSAALEKAKNRSRDLEIQRKKLELDVKARQDSIAKYRTQQFQTRKNEEFQALGQEIERMEREISSIEDHEIELMEEAETTQREARAAESAFKIGQTQNQQQLGALAKKKELLDTRLRDLENERKRIVESLDPDLVFQYSRLFASKGGDAIVPIEHEVCMGCHMKNTTTTVHRVKLGREILHCEQCGRILYWPH